MRARRSCLSVPGSEERMLTKAGGLGADEIVVDLEDSVAPGEKHEARELVARLLSDGTLPAGMAVRVNPPGSRWWQDDVDALAGSGIGSIVVPKVEGAAELRRVEQAIPEVALQALVETAAGLQHVGEIAEASPRLEALIIGYADLAASLGRPPCDDSPGRWLHAQESVLVAARAGGLQAIDGPHLALDDEEGLRWRAEYSRELGYDGKWAVHPSQVEVINDAYTPPRREFERAVAVLAVLERAEAEDGRGAVDLDGEMLDEASRKLAQLTVARGHAAGLVAEEPG